MDVPIYKEISTIEFPILNSGKCLLLKVYIFFCVVNCTNYFPFSFWPFIFIFFFETFTETPADWDPPIGVQIFLHPWPCHTSNIRKTEHLVKVLFSKAPLQLAKTASQGVLVLPRWLIDIKKKSSLQLFILFGLTL